MAESGDAENQIILYKLAVENPCLFTDIERNSSNLYYLRCVTNQSCIYFKNAFFIDDMRK